jgi:hypothetical protein
MSAREAAIQVLSDAGEPLHSEEITKRILENRLWETTAVQISRSRQAGALRT